MVSGRFPPGKRCLFTLPSSWSGEAKCLYGVDLTPLRKAVSICCDKACSEGTVASLEIVFALRCFSTISIGGKWSSTFNAALEVALNAPEITTPASCWRLPSLSTIHFFPFPEPYHIDEA